MQITKSESKKFSILCTFNGKYIKKTTQTQKYVIQEGPLPSDTHTKVV
jgi:hypothetical protein